MLLYSWNILIFKVLTLPQLFEVDKIFILYKSKKVF